LHVLHAPGSLQIEECAMRSMFPKEGEAGWSGAILRVTERRSTLLIIYATAVATGLFVGSHVADDAYITFRYGENVAAGAGLV
jgi:hypothetical protein